MPASAAWAQTHTTLLLLPCGCVAGQAADTPPPAAAAAAKASSDSYGTSSSAESSFVEDEEEAERVQQAVEVVAEMQLTAEQLKVGTHNEICAGHWSALTTPQSALGLCQQLHMQWPKATRPVGDSSSNMLMRTTQLLHAPRACIVRSSRPASSCTVQTHHTPLCSLPLAEWAAHPAAKPCNAVWPQRP